MVSECRRWPPIAVDGLLRRWPIHTFTFTFTFTLPPQVAKTRLAVATPGTYEGLGHCLRSSVRAEGLGALYKGLGASLIGIIPFSAVDLALYNTFKAELRYHRRSEPGTLTMLG